MQSILAASPPRTFPALTFNDFQKNQTVWKWENKKQLGSVLIFLSIVCPCSKSHETKIAQLIADFPQFDFIGISSNKEEPRSDVPPYFKKAGLPFLTLVDDSSQQLANLFGALKTPHAFLVDTAGRELYRGGVDNSHSAVKASQDWLRAALAAVVKGQPIRVAETRPMGCIISR